MIDIIHFQKLSILQFPMFHHNNYLNLIPHNLQLLNIMMFINSNCIMKMLYYTLFISHMYMKFMYYTYYIMLLNMYYCNKYKLTLNLLLNINMNSTNYILKQLNMFHLPKNKFHYLKYILHNIMQL